MFCDPDPPSYESILAENARLREALEPFSVAYERWADGGCLTGWQASRMKQSVDAHRFRRAYEVFRKG